MKYEKGNRVYVEGKGAGTVTAPTYRNNHFTTSTPVLYDNYLGQKLALAEDTELLKPLSERRK